MLRNSFASQCGRRPEAGRLHGRLTTPVNRFKSCRSKMSTCTSEAWWHRSRRFRIRAHAWECDAQVRMVGFCGGTEFLSWTQPLVSYPRILDMKSQLRFAKTQAATAALCRNGRGCVSLFQLRKCASCLRGRPNACQFNETLGATRRAHRNSSRCHREIVSGQPDAQRLCLVEPLTVGFMRHRVDESPQTTQSRCSVDRLEP